MLVKAAYRYDPIVPQCKYVSQRNENSHAVKIFELYFFPSRRHELA
jgi:hypothetical protein